MTRDLRTLAAAVVDVWNGGAPDRIHALLAPDYRGHMLHAQDGDRDGAVYVDAIERYRAANPGAAIRIVEQLVSGDRIVTRLEARRSAPLESGSLISRGINISRFDAAGLLVEEWAIWTAWLADAAIVRSKDR